MADILRPVLELTILLPGMVLCFLPMPKYLKLPGKRLALVGIPVLLAVCLLAGWLCYVMAWKTLPVLAILLLVMGVLFCRALRMSVWKSASVFLGMCGVFSCLLGLGNVVDALLREDAGLWLCLPAALVYNAMGWALTGLAWWPARKAVPALLDDEGMAGTWYVFWVFPLVFVGLNRFMIPDNPNILFQGRVMAGYILLSLTLLALLGLLYLMFYRMARGITEGARLRQENAFLQMQRAQYSALQGAVAETRQARHDLRHHVNVLHTLMERGEWSEAMAYLEQARAAVPASELNVCENPAVDAVACHYAALCHRSGIPLSCKMDLSDELPVAEMDVCVALSNLLENALEASLRTEGARREIRVRAKVHGEKLVLLSVENTYDGEIVEKGGVLQSSKRRGEGVGLQSVRRIAEKNGGYCDFTYENGIFRADVMLRGGE